MKKMFKLSLGAAFVVAAIGFAPESYAFHDGGVAECEGCHTMHNSEGGAAVTTTGGLTRYNAGPYLLQGNTQSEACLNCHNSTSPGSYHISTDSSIVGVAGSPPINYTPGGDFGWLKKSYTFTLRGSSVTENTGGHVINAPFYGFNPPIGETAPGGTFQAGNLNCSSCHDPHGKYRRLSDGTIADGTTTSLPIQGSGSYNTSSAPSATFAVGVYRLLGGKNYTPKSTGYSFGATVDPPVAVANSTYNIAETNNGAGQRRVAYGQGMSEWCGNCHGGLVQNNYVSGTTHLTHPAGNSAKFTAVEVANYGAYVSSGNLSGTAASSYWTLTPFEVGSNDYDTAGTGLKALAATTQVLTGPVAGTSNVMCLSCHRAHASGFPSSTRFLTTYEMITGVDASGNATYTNFTPANTGISRGRTEAEMTAAYYGRPASVWGPYQRDLCNKCHAKD